MKKAQRLHREPDPRVRRVLGVALATSALLVAGALTVVGVRLEQVHLAYRLDALRGDRTRAAETIRQLEIEVATLQSPSRLEARARQIGLVAAVRAAVPRAAWPRRLHVATRTFQALRIAVNDETGALNEALADAPPLLAHGGRLGVISFHSGEDRIVKRTFRALEPAGFAELEPSPRQPTDDEVRGNPRARSAKLRVLERLP